MSETFEMFSCFNLTSSLSISLFSVSISRPLWVTRVSPCHWLCPAPCPTVQTAHWTPQRPSAGRTYRLCPPTASRAPTALLSWVSIYIITIHFIYCDTIMLWCSVLIPVMFWGSMECHVNRVVDGYDNHQFHGKYKNIIVLPLLLIHGVFVLSNCA